MAVVGVLLGMALFFGAGYATGVVTNTKVIEVPVIKTQLVGYPVPGDQGLQGESGKNGEDGKDGKNIISSTFTIKNIYRNTTPWDNFYVESDNNGKVLLPEKFTINALTSNENGGWIDVYIGSQTFCYQGKTNTKLYEFKYKKLSGANTGCDTNNDKEPNATSFIAEVKINDKVGVVPRSPKLQDITWEISFSAFLVEN